MSPRSEAVSVPTPTSKQHARSVRAQLARILASREFASAERMSRFLSFAVCETLEGRSGKLKEYSIGLEAFDRPQTFDPGIDPIVRVEARRLRTKLEKYYATDGRHDDFIIELPKGGYVPRFRERTAADAETSPQRKNTVAVLPFVDLSPSPDSSYFSEGLTWELIHRLTRLEDLSIVAWNGDPADTRAIGEQLKARVVLAGSVRRAGNRLRIIAQLVDVATGVYVWSETYDREVEDVFAIQEDIASAIASTLQLRLGQKQTGRYNFEAYEIYLRGRVEWNRRTAESLWQSISSFREAAAIDPSFALAYAGLSDAYSLLADYGFEKTADTLPEAKSMAQKALYIDPSLAEAHCSLALVLALYEWRWADAEEHFRLALEYNPGYATAHHWFGCDYLAMVGRFDEARREVEIAHHLDPLNPVVAEGRGYVVMLQRQHDEAVRHYEAVATQHPTFYKVHGSFGRALMQAGRYAEALEHFARARGMTGSAPSILGATGQCYGWAGQPDRARETLNELHQLSTERHVSGTCFALVHLGLGERDRALDWLERSRDARELNLASIGTHPAYDDLRSEPRFTALLQQLGLG